MATRLLLTLLALLTGLAAQLSPAQARIRAEGAEAVGALATVLQSERTAAVRLSAPARPAPKYQAPHRCVVVMALKEAATCAPPVMLGIDRARE